MEKSESPDKRLLRQDVLVSKVREGIAVIEVIPEGKFEDYLSAGLATGFKVEKIAAEGGEFPLLSKSGLPGKSIERIVKIIKVENKGNIAVSIERLEDSDKVKGHSPFWEKLKEINQNKALASSKSPAKP